MYNIITLKMVEDIILLLLMYNCCIEYLDLIKADIIKKKIVLLDTFEIENFIFHKLYIISII